MIQHESRIERGIAEMNHFKIDGHHSRPIHEEVFRTPVAVGEAYPAGGGFRDQTGSEGLEVRMPARGGAIVRVDAQLIENGLIAELPLPISLPPGRARHPAQQPAYLLRS